MFIPKFLMHPSMLYKVDSCPFGQFFLWVYSGPKSLRLQNDFRTFEKVSRY